MFARWLTARREIMPDARDLVALSGLAFLTYGGEMLTHGLGFLIAGAVLVFVAVRR